MNDTTASHEPITPIAARSYTVNIRGPRSSPAMRLRLNGLGKIRTEQLCDRNAQARRGEPSTHGTREALDGLIDLFAK